MGAQSATAQNYISNEVGLELTRAGLAYDHPMRPELEEKAVIVGDDRNLFVRVPDGHGGTRMLADEIERLKHDPCYVATIPVAPKKVAKRDMKKLTENFDAIASGKMIVE